MPSRRIREKGGRVHGFQIWVNLPAKLKMTRPRYQEVSAGKIPEAKSEDGRARVRVIAGEALGMHAVIDTHIPIVYQDWTIDAAADLTVALPRKQQALVYVFQGAVLVGNDGREVRDGQMALLGEGDAVRLRGAAGGGRLLLLAGVPIREPVARYGPFVMNTQQELVEAVRDYQSGRMGEITRTAEVL
jgi:redox-sensitive bicupin YhaK (pirin superfamily)